jgi:hypothetical protein
MLPLQMIKIYGELGDNGPWKNRHNCILSGGSMTKLFEVFEGEGVLRHYP